MCSKTPFQMQQEDPQAWVQYGTAQVCIVCLKTPTRAAFDATTCNHCGGRMFFEKQVEIKHPWEDYKRPDIYEGDGNDYVPEWMENIEW